jgi:hypothetical protein
MLRRIALSLAALVAGASAAHADTIAIGGTGPTGAFTGTIEYNFDGDPATTICSSL